MPIRDATHDDQSDWLRMRSALWPHASAAEHRAEMAEQLADQHRTFAVFVADGRDGQLIGFLEASLRRYAEGCDTSPVGYIEGWYVDGAARRQGIGEQLVGAAEQWARDRGCTEMASDCLIDNAVSWQAHLALGYEEAERLIHFRKLLTSS